MFALLRKFLSPRDDDISWMIRNNSNNKGRDREDVPPTESQALSPPSSEINVVQLNKHNLTHADIDRFLAWFSLGTTQLFRMPMLYQQCANRIKELC
jgi:hypothetical protein